MAAMQRGFHRKKTGKSQAELCGPLPRTNVTIPTPTMRHKLIVVPLCFAQIR